MRADPHPNEQRRLAVLFDYGILDTAPETDFDDIVKLASKLCDVPISVVNIIDKDRQWFKAEVGLGVRETPIDSSICAHAILAEDFVEIPDTALDCRFSDNPLVHAEPGFRFYAGALLKTPEGLPLGTLCVLDTKPRQLTDLQRQALRTLGRQVMAQLELRRTARALEEKSRKLTEERRDLARTMEKAEVGTIEWDVVRDRITMNSLLAEFFGLEEGHAYPISDLMDAIHPDDRAGVDEALQRSLRGGVTYEIQYRVTGREGRMRHVLGRGDVTRDAEGKPVGTAGVVLDVTSRMQALAAVRESEERRRLALEAAGIGAWSLPMPARKVTGDRRFWELFCGNPEPGEGQDTIEVIHPEDRAKVRDATDAAIDPANPVPFDEEYRVIHPDGSTHWRSVVGRAVFREVDGVRTAVSLNGTMVDVTNERAAEEALRAREELFRTVFEQAPDDAIIMLDGDRILNAWNPAAERITGWAAEDVVGQPADIIFTSEGRASGAPEREVKAASEQGKAVDERWHLRKDGTRFWGSGTMNALHDADGNVSGFLKVFRDATERHERVRTLDFLRRLNDALVDERDPDTIIAAVQEMLGERLGLDRALYAEFSAEADSLSVIRAWPAENEISGDERPLTDLGHSATANAHAGRTDVVQGSEAEERRESLGVADMAGAVTIPLRKEGRTVGVFLVATREPHDWTDSEVGLVQQVADRMVAELDRARAEIALAQANEQLELRVAERTAELAQAVEQAEGFNYSISHDLRSPLRAVAASAKILLEELGPDLSDDHRSLLERQSFNAVRLGRLIDELLRLSRFSRVEVKREAFDMTRKALSVFDELTEQDRANGCHFEAQEGMSSTGDRDLVRTVLHNLIGNACKFSPKGGTVRMTQEGDVFTVSDEGIGFDMAHAKRMFQPFERLVSNTEFDGTGIGLANVKRIVERHGGKVWAESVPAHGSRFSFTLGG